MIVTFAGNRIDEPNRVDTRFPPSNESAVRERVAAYLESAQPEQVVGAAAAGADLIVLSEARRLAIPVHIVLPLTIERFRRRSVADHGPKWVEMFDHLISTAEGLTVDDLSRYEDWYFRGNEVILSTAKRLAAQRPVSGLVVCGPDDRSVSSDFRDRIRQRGWSCEMIDPGRP